MADLLASPRLISGSAYSDSAPASSLFVADDRTAIPDSVMPHAFLQEGERSVDAPIHVLIPSTRAGEGEEEQQEVEGEKETCCPMAPICLGRIASGTAVEGQREIMVVPLNPAAIPSIEGAWKSGCGRRRIAHSAAHQRLLLQEEQHYHTLDHKTELAEAVGKQPMAEFERDVLVNGVMATASFGCPCPSTAAPLSPCPKITGNLILIVDRYRTDSHPM
ncbi:hypothetical protein Taro_038322 [Colocasia esculenta]|uniref:Uncharacterized protein n=1 Tax=Colocasia esculenta TaxID=4460 RepID=A0A843WCG1_COLES|nr:hypothetical protein [Colocasia esculenta]